VAISRQETASGNLARTRSNPNERPRDLAARAAQTSPRNIQDAKFVAKHSLKLLNDVKSEKITLPQAKREILREQKRTELTEKAKAAPPANDDQKIIIGDCIMTMQTLPRRSFRLIFADPPYNIGVDYGQGAKADRLADNEYVNWCFRWISEGAELLTPDGSFWLLIGDEYADYIGLELRNAGLHRRAWIKWYETFGVNAAGNFNRCSRHLFYCVKDRKKFVFNADAVNRPSDRLAKYGDKRADPAGKNWDDIWGINPPIPRLVGTAKERIPDFPTQLPQSLLRPIIGCASDPGDQVLDPFCGSATTGIVCAELGRKFVGIEKSKNFADMARMRLAAERKSS
jgi:DNA modification methylase